MKKKIVIIDNNWDCPYFRDGFRKVDVKLPRFGCKLTGEKCTETGCPLDDYIEIE